MRAAIYKEFQGDIQISNVPDPILEDHGVLLKVLATGLCLSDWHGWQGHDKDIKLPHVPGHEMVGEVLAIGKDVRHFKTGERVTLPFVCGCGQCNICRQGNPQVCPDQFQPGFTHWGSFAEMVSIHYADFNLAMVPDSIASTTAASLGCRFVTSFRGVVQQGRLKADETVVIFGCGGVGLSAIMIAAALGARIIAVDVKQSALDKAIAIGADYVINSSKINDLPGAIHDITDGGADVTIDAIGHQQVVQQAIQSLGRRGRHVQIGLLSPESAMTNISMDKVIAWELEILGSHGIAAISYPEIFQNIESGKFQPQKLIDSTISLEQAIVELPLMDAYPGSGVRVIDKF